MSLCVDITVCRVVLWSANQRLTILAPPCGCDRRKAKFIKTSEENSERLNNCRSDIIGISRHINITNCQTQQRLSSSMYILVSLSDNPMFSIDSRANEMTDFGGESGRLGSNTTMTNRQFSDVLNSLNICLQFITSESIARCTFSI